MFPQLLRAAVTTGSRPETWLLIGLSNAHKAAQTSSLRYGANGLVAGPFLRGVGGTTSPTTTVVGTLLD
jgi:hypothetical protein